MCNSVSVELSPLRAHLDRLTALPSPQSLVNSLEDGVSLFQPAFPVDVEATRAYYDQQPLPLIVLGPPANSSNAGADIPPVQRPPTPSAGTLLASYEPRTLAASPSTPVEVPRWSEAYEGEEEGILIGEEEDISLVHDTPLQDRAEQGAVIWIPNRPPALSTLGHNPLPGSTDHHLVSYTGTVTGEVSALSTLGIIGHGSALGLILEKEFSFHCPRPIYGAQGFILMGEECFYDYRFDYFRPHFRPYWHENVWRS
ncbi:hypothetical protein MPER_04813 [Moniliophthora perniciosa FA553]|nr:hypothetical protein MPER_04813 [Moniliophthora perniciosa FA553]